MHLKTTEIVTIILVLFGGFFVRPIFADDMSTIRERYITAVVPREGEMGKNFQRSAHEIAKSQQPDGSWSDIDYADKSRSAWKSVKHLNNLLQMAKVNAATPDAKLKDAVIKGLAWWLKNDPHNPNWWHNEIGTPQLLGEIAMLMGDDLPADQREGVINIMKRSVWTKWTGQNLVWGVGIQVVRGILEKNEQTIADAYARMYEEVRVEKPQGEGIMPDASFHQHGSQFYSGGYGLNFANDVGRFVSYSWGTRFQIPPEKMAIYTRFMLDGEQWMIRGSTFDYSATGREITRAGKTALPRNWMSGAVNPPGAGYGLGAVVSALAKLDVPRRDEFEEFAKRLRGDSSAKPLSGNRYYWCSDYMADQRSDFSVSVRMFSSRLFNSELVNDEGKKSHHLADGCTFIYRSGDEYRDIFPVWDWNKVPGTTAEQGELERGGNHIKAKSDFVGGVSDGTYGVCVQDLQRGTLKAHKFWMALDDGFVALGAGIDCESDNPVVTSINQCLLHGDTRKNDHSVWHDGFTYAIPAPQKWNLATGAQTGNWSDLGTGPSDPVTMNVFNLSIDHGLQPRNGTYCYFVFAREDRSSDIKILSNTPTLQAVSNSKMKLLGIAFWKAGKLEAEGSAVEVDQPCLVLVRDKQVSVSNPRSQPLTVHLAIDGKAMTFDLPGGAAAGSTVTK